MKTWTLLLALLLALSLTACGGKQNDGGVTGTNNGTQTGGTANDNANGNTGDSITGNANGNTGTGGSAANKPGSNTGNTVTGSGNGSTGTNGTVNGTNDANGNIVPGDIDGNGDSLLNPDSGTGSAANSGNGSTASNGVDGSTANNGQNSGNPVRQSHGGWKAASFDQMVRNGRVHDRDGVLTDFENSVTPGSSHF